MTVATTLSTDTYWSNFEVADQDIDFIINFLLEREIPLASSEMSFALVERHLERLKKEAEKSKAPTHDIYLPKETYKIGQKLTFQALNNSIGEVVGLREGENPEIGEFDVIEVAFKGNGQKREFAARLEDHPLNNPPEREEEEQALQTPESVMDHYGEIIEERLEERLEKSDDIVRIAWKWFPRALVADITEGHLNLAEAVLDVASGGPLPTADMLAHVDLPSNLSPQLAEFSLNYALQEDQRFDEVGPAGEILWFLRRLEPPEVQFTPPRLEYEGDTVDRRRFTPELLDLERRLDDELSDVELIEPAGDEVTISLIFPHWRVGALPLSARLRPLFPTAYEAPRIRFMLVDGHSGDTFPGWVVREEGYVFGLEEWYRQYDVPVGGLVRVRKSEEAGQVIVDTLDRRMRNDWIRTVSVSEGNQVGFTMLKQPVGTAYDDLMVIGLVDKQVIDEVWMKQEKNKTPLDRTVANLFRDLAKLTPQGAVHAQTLYAAVNVVNRQPPAAVFEELVTRPYYQHVGDLYWRFEPSAWSGS
ncbi:MAG: hypothetical protein PVI81_08945 [Anaerolineales bacterium]|jgi:hypothetical protein